MVRLIFFQPFSVPKSVKLNKTKKEDVSKRQNTNYTFKAKYMVVTLHLS